jgi:ribosomal protein L11 methyltransferase
MDNSLLKISSKIHPEQVEFLEVFLYEEAPSPWVLEVNHINGNGTLTGYFSSQNESNIQQSKLTNALDQVVQFSFTSALIQDQDWKEAYKAHFSPWTYMGVNLVPTWEKETYQSKPSDINIYLDPGMAFGTGNHESTRMCLEFLIESVRNGCSQNNFIDLGCGSGILSLVAKSIGFQNVLGIDNDPDAVRISGDNALLNNLKESIAFQTKDLNQLTTKPDKFDFVMANIQADILINYAEVIMSLTKDQATIVLSGILTKEIDQVTEKFLNLAPESDTRFSQREMGEWSALKINK